jgi:hypothetical protein
LNGPKTESIKSTVKEFLVIFIHKVNFMYRVIIMPKESKFLIELPEALIGKPLEVLAFEMELPKDLVSEKRREKAIPSKDQSLN